MRRPKLIVALVLACVGLASAGAVAAKTASVTLGAGDTIVVSGTDLRCAVSTAKPRTIVCGLGSAAQPRAGTYGFAMADDAALLLHAGASTPTSVLSRRQPAVRGGVFAVRGSGHPRTVTVHEGEAVFVAGTHVSCAVTPVAGKPSVACGLLSASSRGAYASGSFAGVVTDAVAGIVRTAKNGAVTTVIREAQP